MEPHDIPKCLDDIRTSIEAIESYLMRFLGDSRDFNIYKQERFLRRCVDLRNWVIHAYDNVNDTIVTKHLPPLKTEVKWLLENFPHIQ